GDVHEIKNARSGIIREENGAMVLEYDDVQDEEKAHIILTMHPGRNAMENRARMQRRGMVASSLAFLPGQKAASSYVTIYGEIPVAVDTRRVLLTREENSGTLLLDYDVYMGGELTSGALLEVTWRL
ncbi:MAG: DUF1934 domain-containing protein, partial [Eubacteriales bacterium]|nr:DUF1934 domain-containing protein [Eubacteriales bacterium]